MARMLIVILDTRGHNTTKNCLNSRKMSVRVAFSRLTLVKPVVGLCSQWRPLLSFANRAAASWWSTRSTKYSTLVAPPSSSLFYNSFASVNLRLNMAFFSSFEPHESQSILSQGRLLIQKPFYQPQRGHIKFSMRKCKQKTVRPVIRRFYRLQWGAWIRPMAGKAKKLWKKSWKRRQRLRRHVVCNATQKRLLDHMVTRFWKKPKYYVDDPYQPYHIRHGIHRLSEYPSTFR